MNGRSANSDFDEHTYRDKFGITASRIQKMKSDAIIYIRPQLIGVLN